MLNAKIAIRANDNAINVIAYSVTRSLQTWVEN